ncbi:hypothetical protein [Stenotrophomonas sp. 24(2023)]|uniref:hypothetical protein n=1 Tax=Stenotrophomonas sp. 24(2023) TaxID=3068324 RepID=UPI0027DF22E5|nr:hypothetical protein [Stenotrophomonas sp. 24(2023)]WMJ70973.1 hypothetical protein Q9R17_07705 [Stenotrophomonas sp. 24(2023)]
MSEPNAPRDADARALSQALREQEQQVPVLDVSEAVQQRLQAETRDNGVVYVLVQVLLLGALLGAAAWYFWH